MPILHESQREYIIRQRIAKINMQSRREFIKNYYLRDTGSMKAGMKLYKRVKYQDTTPNEIYGNNHKKCKHFISKKQVPNTRESTHIFL